MAKLATTNHQVKVNILWVLWLLSYVILDTIDKDPVPGFVRPLDLGITTPQLAIKVIKGIYYIHFSFFFNAILAKWRDLNKLSLNKHAVKSHALTN